jgi:AcrR family transcriptional regulator
MAKGRKMEHKHILEALTEGHQPQLKVMGRRERRAAETRLRLFRSALQLFADRGFSNVTVEDITEAADVGKGTFFNYFESKDHVLSVMAEIQLARVRDAAKVAALGKATIQRVLHQLFLQLAEEPGRSAHLARALISSFLANEVVRNLIKKHMSDGRAVIAEIIGDGQRRGEINPRLNKDAVALQAQQAFMGTMLLWSLHEDDELTVWIDASFQHFWRAIANVSREQKP